MSQIIRAIPVLSSSDVKRDMQWWQEKAGFKSRMSKDEYQNEWPMYAIMQRGDIFIHLQWHSGTESDPIHASSIRIQVDQIGSIFQEFVDRGTVADNNLRTDTPWGTHEFGFYDLNNNAIHILSLIHI